jgi:hypothetical protein
MGIFNLKIKIGELKVERKESDWEVSYPSTNRVVKTCTVCGHKANPMRPKKMTTFTKKIKTGDKREYNALYACGPKDRSCTQKLAKKLNVQL